MEMTQSSAADEDRISGGDGDDNLLGNAGNDVLRPGAAMMTCRAEMMTIST